MIKLPEVLKNKSFRFIKIRPGQKAPAEEDWPMTNNYKYNDPDFVEYLRTASAYGVVCGFGKLAIIDCDNLESAEMIMTALPDTFTVLSPGHKSPHLYFIIKDLANKIIMTDDNGMHHGEVQFIGQQCLGPNSLHPNRKQYKVIKDIEIKYITKKELLAAVEPFTKAEEEVKLSDSGVNFDISLILPKVKGMIEKSNGEWQGSNPMHGSEGGMNFTIDPIKNKWHCFRCPSGGDAISLVALLEGIVPCEELKRGYFQDPEHKEQFKLALKIAENKYGYVNPKKAGNQKQFEISRKLAQSEIVELVKPSLVFNLLREIQKEGVVGEEESILVLINRIMMRCVKNYTLTSGNIIVSDNTGLGKDNVTEKICKVMLVKNKTLYSATCISDKALNYWHPGFEGASWDGRVMYLQDPEEDALKGQAFKVRASGMNENVTLDTERKIQYIEITGKPILIVTSMSASISQELMRRWDSVCLDPSDELTAAIVNYICRKAAGEIATIPNSILRSAIQNLPRVSVHIPFAKEIIALVPTGNALMRTQISKLIDVIKASTALHQFQRERNSKDFVVATREDLAYAVFITNYCSSVLNGQVLNRKQEQLIKYITSKNEAVPFKTILADNPGMSESWIYRQEHDLVERRLLQMIKEYDPASGRDVKCFKLDLTFNIHIKMPSDLIGYFSSQLEKDINKERKKLNLPDLKLF